MTFPQEIAPRGAVQNVLTRRNFLTSPEVTPLQAQVDGLVNGFVRDATDSGTLAALMAGGLAYRFGRIGVMAAGEGFFRSGFLLRGASVVGGFGLELGSYEFTRRLLSNDSNPNRWNWSGQGGWGQGLATSAITFGMLKSAGFVAREQNIAFQHLFQGTSMVLGHDAAASFDLVPQAEGSFAERLLHAEATNLQLGAGMGLVHSVSPGLSAFERGLDLSLRNQIRGPIEGSLSELSPALAVSSAGRGGVRPQSSRPDRIFSGIMEMSSNEQNGNGGPKAPSESGRSRGARGDETVQIKAYRLWDPYGIEGIPRGAQFLRLDSSSQNPIEEILHLVQRELSKDVPNSLVVGFEGEGFDETSQFELRYSLTRYLNEAHRQKPIPQDVVIAVGIPQREAALIFRPQGEKIQVERVFLDAQGGVTLRADDTPDEEAEASAEEMRASLPPDMAVAATVMQIYQAIKDRIAAGNLSIPIQYEAKVWGEESLVTRMAGWLEKPINHFPPEGRIILHLSKNQRRVSFFWENEKIKYQIEDSASGSPDPSTESPTVSSPRTPVPPPRTPPPPREVITEPPATGPRTPTTEKPPVSQAAGDTTPPFSSSSEKPPSSPSSTGVPVAVANNVAGLVSRAGAVARETGRGDFSLVYTGDPSLISPRDYESLENSLSGLIKGQTCSVYLTQSRSVVEIEGEGGGKLRRSQRAWSEPPAFSNNSVRTFGDLVQNLLHFLPPGRRVLENPVITYLGKNWRDGPVLEMLIDLLSEHLPVEGQTITLKSGRDPRVVVERRGDQIVARLYSPEGAPQDFTLIPDTRSGKLKPIESVSGRSYSYQPLSEHYREAAGLVSSVLGVKGIGAIVQKRLNTGLPLETVIQAPIVRGRLLAEIVNEILKNIELPSYLEQWGQVHRLIERAYAHLDFEAVQSYRRNLSDFMGYEKAVKNWNDRVSSPQDALVSLEEMSTEEPGIALIPKWETLRDAMASPLFSTERSVWASRLLVRDAERLGQVFAHTFNGRLESFLQGVDALERKIPPQSLSDFLNRDLATLDPEEKNFRKEFLGLMDHLPDLKRILTDGHGPFNEAFLRAALQSQPNIRQAYSRLREALSKLETLHMARHNVPALPSLEELEAPLSQRP